MSSMIESSNLGFTYDGENFALCDVNVNVRAGEFVCILGGNGSGKSTLAKHINALLIPDEGSMQVNGNDTSNQDALYLIRSTAGMVFQNPDDQLVASLVEDDVAFGPENLGVESPEIAQRVKDALAEVGLMGFEKHETHALSGGQKQRVAIAGVLAMRPKILILDEASAMLDPRGRKGLMRVCRELHEQGMTIVMITHFMEEAANADRVIVLEEGQVALEGTPDEVLVRTDVLNHLNLEVPFACEFSQRLQALDVNVRTAVHESQVIKQLQQDAPDAFSVERQAEGEQHSHHGVNVQRSAAGGEQHSSHHGASTQCFAEGERHRASEQHCTNDTPLADLRTARSDKPILIQFDHVSYTYDEAMAKRQQKARKRKQKAAERAAKRGRTGKTSISEDQSKVSPENLSEASPEDLLKVSPEDLPGAPLEDLSEVSSKGLPDAPLKDAPEALLEEPPEELPEGERAKWGNHPQALWAVHDVSFSVYEGEFLGIAGHTGSGKSTLIQHMNGLVHPTMGRVLVQGQDITSKQAATEARSLVGVVFQYPEHQLFASTVYDDVAFGPRNMGLSDDEIATRVQESLERVGLDFESIREKSPFELSGGQQRRVAFAGVLAMRPHVLVLDEPAAGLDPAARHDFLEMIAGLHKQGLTVVMVSHNMDDLARLTDRVVIMKEGELLCVGTPDEVFVHAEELNDVGLGMPSPQRMATKLRAAGMPLATDVLYSTDSLAHEVANRVMGANAKRAKSVAGEDA